VVPETTASLSRRQVLGGGGTVLAATLGARFLPQSPGDDTTRVEWPMTQRDPGATGYTPTSSGPVTDATIRWKQPLDTGFAAYSVPSVATGGTPVPPLSNRSSSRPWGAVHRVAATDRPPTSWPPWPCSAVTPPAL